MTPFIAHIITTVLSCTLSVLIVYLLFAWDETFILWERFGLGMLGGSIIIGIGATWNQVTINSTTFWYQWLWRVGLILYLSGRAFRLRRHWKGNVAQNDVARQYYGERLVDHDGIQKDGSRQTHPSRH